MAISSRSGRFHIVDRRSPIMMLGLGDLSVLALSLWSECDELVPAFATVMQMDIRNEEYNFSQTDSTISETEQKTSSYSILLTRWPGFQCVGRAKDSFENTGLVSSALRYLHFALALQLPT
ncbi:hypothetical protein KIN20_008384 [Parelaphostrongylus tenuis]|uniref:Uncharacterized protein n=1 Tax=Parelaphostrongylus tenuis TaxID=148309 RepID=A0AAD5QHG8_PARTN|nr:hypothetical protein KIN20_008384 [Parelaphostrongylus tenuis]